MDIFIILVCELFNLFVMMLGKEMDDVYLKVLIVVVFCFDLFVDYGNEL